MNSTPAAAVPSHGLLEEIATGELFRRFRDAFHHTSRLQLRLVPRRPERAGGPVRGTISLCIPIRGGGMTCGYLMLEPFTLCPDGGESGPPAHEAAFSETAGPQARFAHPRSGSTPLPALDRRFANAAETLLRLFALQLGEHAEKLMLHHMAMEPLMVRKAREYIAGHLGTPLTLGRVAGHAGASTCNFCKVFKKSTGLTFTAFVARARVEEAKRLLDLPHLTVTEVAYRAGFQSLSQFNRSFKKLVLVSPRGYREARCRQSMHRN